MKPVKNHCSWKVCPMCSSRATKIFNMVSGKYNCQVCDCQYSDPSDRDLLDKKYKFTILLGSCEQYQYTVFGDTLSQIDLQVLALVSNYDKFSPRPVRLVNTAKGYPEGTRTVVVAGYKRFDGKRFNSIVINMVPV